MPTLGHVQIDHPFALAALSGFSDLAMRRIARMFGAAYAINQVTLDSSVTHESEWQRRLCVVEPDDHPVGAQIMGDVPDKCAAAARFLANAGYDVIDINFGCPAPKILKRGHGGCMLGRPGEAIDIIRAVIDTVGPKMPVTVKLRRGVDERPESERAVFEIIDGALSAGVAGLIVHGRTVRQRYMGESDSSFVRRVKEHVGDLTVFGSGDLLSAQACVEMIEQTGVEGVTIARGAMGNPWIFRDCLALSQGSPLPPPPTLDEQRRIIMLQYEQAVAAYGRDYAGVTLPKHVLRYSRHHPSPKKLRIAFVKIRTPEVFEAAMERWYDPAFDPANPPE